MIINEDYLDNVEVADENPADEVEIDVIPKVNPELLSNKEIVTKIKEICGEMTVQHFKDYADNKKSRFIGRASYYYKAMFTNVDGDWRQTSFIAYQPQDIKFTFFDKARDIGEKIHFIAKVCGELRYMTEFTFRNAITGNETDLSDWRKFSPDDWVEKQEHSTFVKIYNDLYSYYIFKATHEPER